MEAWLRGNRLTLSRVLCADWPALPRFYLFYAAGFWQCIVDLYSFMNVHLYFKRNTQVYKYRTMHVENMYVYILVHTFIWIILYIHCI